MSQPTRLGQALGMGVFLAIAGFVLVEWLVPAFLAGRLRGWDLVLVVCGGVFMSIILGSWAAKARNLTTSVWIDEEGVHESSTEGRRDVPWEEVLGDPMHRFFRSLALLAFAALAPGFALAADVHVMISAGFFHAYSELLPKFEQQTGHHVITVRGPSMGDSPEAIPTRLARGESADVVILDGDSADKLAERGLVKGDTKVTLARSLIGAVVKAGDPKPDISTVDAFRQALLDAKSIAYSDSGSGTYLSTRLFAQLGVAEQVKGKSRKVRGPPSGEPVAAVVARGEAQLGFQQVSEVINVPGTTFVGPIPSELQPGFTFAGAVTTSAREPDAARALLAYLASPEAAPVLEKAGLAAPAR